MANKPMEVFPDLHHKMSKKIAQLTKVIYHLNTKNEDHQTELDVLASNHQVEIQHILKDAAVRIGKFKEVVESKQAALNQDAKLEKLQKKHDLEKQAALQEFSNFKSKMNEREQKISSEFLTKFEGARREIENMNKKFQEKIQQFDSTNQELRKALQDNSSNVAGMQELQTQHDREVAELVKSSNEKYQAMLLQQLQAQDDLRRELEAKMAAEKQQLVEKHRSELDQEIGQIRAKLNGDKQEALLTLRRELEDKLTAQKVDYMGKMEKLIADLRAKSEECDRITETKNATIADLERKIASIHQSLSDQVGGQEAKVGMLSKEVQELTEKLQGQSAKLVQREEEIVTLQKIMSDKTAVIVKLEMALAKAEEEVARLRRELETAQSSGASAEQDLKSRLSTAERESASFRAEINQIAATLATVRDDLKKSEKNAQKISADSEKAIAVLTSDKDLLAAKLAELQKNNSSLSEQSGLEVSNLKRAMADREDEMRKEKLSLLEANQRALDSLKDSHRVEVDALSSTKQAVIDKLTLRESQLTNDLAAQRSEYDSRMDTMQRDNVSAVSALTERHREEVDGLKASMAALEGQLQNLSEQADTERTTLRGEVSKLDLKAKALQKELDAKKKDGERAESVTTGLKNQVESLREELKASQKAFRDKMDMSTAKLEAEWQQRLDAQIALGQKALRDAAEELYASHRAETAELIVRHEEEVKSLKGLLQKEALAASADLANNEHMRLKLEAELNEEKAARAAQVADLSSKHMNDLKLVEEAKRHEIERLRRELANSSESRESAMLQSHNAEVDRLNRLVESTVQEFTHKMVAALEASKLNADEALRVALSELATRMTGERTAALAEQARVSAKDRADLVSKTDQEKSLLSRELEESRAQLKDSQNQISSMQKLVSDERAERQRREENFVLERDQLLREHESAIRKEKELAERKIIELMERANTDIKILKQEHVEVRGKYEEKIRELNGEYKALQDRWQRRESRPEDLARIEQLEREMVEKDELVARTREEMTFFKREMLNREDNYNQKFNRSPVVGVINPLKAKEEPPANGRAKPTQMRMVNPNGGGMGMGSMGGLGIGGGDMMGVGSSKKK